MNKTKVVNINQEPYDVYIGRYSIWGNPYRIGLDGTRKEVIQKYRIWFLKQIEEKAFHKKTLELKDKILGCHCKPKDCHGDVIVEWLNSPFENL